MSVESKKKKRIKKMIFILIPILIICLILLIFLLIQSNKMEDPGYIIDESVQDDGIEYPYMAYKLFLEYNGNLESEEIAISMQNIATIVFPNYYKELKNSTDEEIEAYYDNQSDSIYEDTGIDNLEDFKNIVQLLNSLNGDDLEFSSYKIDENSIINNNLSVSANLCITYTDNEEIIVKISLFKRTIKYTV